VTKAKQRRQTLKSFTDAEAARDPAFAREFEAAKARTMKKLGRPPQPTTARGTREMRMRAPDEVHEQIVEAAQRSGRTVSNWLLQAAKDKLASGSHD
jgi:predicted HicB family RNase H-like nuclease